MLDIWICSWKTLDIIDCYCFLDWVGFGWFELFQWFVLTLEFAWTVLIVCIVLMFVLVLGKPWTFLIVIASWIGWDCLHCLDC